ncbi:type II toxin-antitoxin system RelE/ParE family toxin [Helicobacter sp. 23-1044]
MAKYNINYAKSFIKDYKKLQTKEKDLTDEIIDKIANGEFLAPKHNDHALSGNLQNQMRKFRHCENCLQALHCEAIRGNPLFNQKL